MSDRSLARFIILSRSNDSAFLLSLSSSGGIFLNAASIAISLASARFTLISRNSFSILSNASLDKSFSNIAASRHYSGWAPGKQRRSMRIAVVAIATIVDQQQKVAAAESVSNEEGWRAQQDGPRIARPVVGPPPARFEPVTPAFGGNSTGQNIVAAFQLPVIPVILPV
jgi:hypothetical protein